VTNVRSAAPNTSYRLRLPGPTEVPARVQEAMMVPVVNHRGPEFREMTEEIIENLQPIFGSSNPILLFAASGTGMMEASLVNAVAPGERVLVVNNGQFAERFADIARALDIVVETIDGEWGHDIDLVALEDRLNQADYRAVIAIHNESSTGGVAELQAIGALLKDRPTLLIVDSVSGLGGIEMRQDDWGVDIIFTAVHKALMCPPGLSAVSVSTKAQRTILQRNDIRGFYWDYRKALKNMETNETPFTPPVSIMAGLRESLRMIHEEGLGNVLDRHRYLSEALIDGARAMGLSCFTQSRLRSNTVAVFDVPAELEAGQIVKALYEKYRTVIAGARNRLNGRVIRFGTMGAVDADAILTDLSQLEAVLLDLGQSVPAGAAVAAAEDSLRSSRHLTG